MAEIAGLILGTTGIVGVIGALKDVIDLFATFADPSNFGRDYEILAAKIDIEKALLLQWAGRMKLLQPDYGKRLDDDDRMQNIVIKVFRYFSPTSPIFGISTASKSFFIIRFYFRRRLPQF